VSYFTELGMKNDAATEEQTMLRGTLALKFADADATPEDGNAVRICMSIKSSKWKKDDVYKVNEWETIGF